jgi:PAS domain S-box-containing protein
MKELRGTILIIEDDAGLMELINERIHDFGYETVCTFSATEALNWLKINSPLLMVLDYSLPDMTAKEFIAALDPNIQPIPPFVLATGRGDERIAVDMMKLGARDYIIKDSHFLDMIQLVVSRVCVEIENETKLKQTEQALIESNRFNKQIIDSAQEGLVVYDKDLKCTTWNPFMEKLTGMKAVDVLGKYASDVFPRLIAAGVIENVQSALQGIIKPGIEFDYMSDVLGKQICISDEVSTLRNAAGEIIGAISIVRDITDRKNAEAETQKVSKHYQAIIEKSPAGFVLLNHEGHFKYFSPSALRIFGYDESDLFAIHPNDLTHPDDLPFVMESLGRLFHEPAFVPVLEYRFKHKSGEWKWIESTFSNLFDDPAVESIVINFRDITERKRAEMVLLESENRYHALFSSSFEAVFLTFPDGTILSANQAACTMFGLTEEELCQGGRENIIDSTDPRLAHALKEREINGKFSGELTFVRGNGEKFPGEFSSIVFEDKDGNIRTSMIVRDITERKRAENELQANRDMLNKLLYASNEFIDSDFDTIDYKKTTDNILEISGAKYASFNIYEEDRLDFKTVAISGIDGIQQKVISILGYDVVNKKWRHDPVRANKLKDNIITRFESFSELAGDILPKSVMSIAEKMFNLGEIWVVQIVKNNKVIGDYTLLFTRGNILKNCEIVELYASHVGLFIERLNSERALRKSEEIYRNLVMRIPDGVYKSTPAGKFIDVNPAMVKMLGYESKEELMNIDIISEHYFDIADRYAAKPNNENEVMSVFQLKKKDGSGIWIEDHGWYNTDIYGNIVYHEGVLRDITERKLAEEALQASEDKYRTMIEFSNDMIWALDLEGNFTFSNEVAERLTGLKLEDWIGKSFVLILSPEDVPAVMDIHMRSISGENCCHELTIKKNDGKMRILSIDTSPIYNQGKIEGVVNFARDITDRKLAERELEEKMNELIRFHDLTVDRELTMIELKKEVNKLLKKTGNIEKYKIIE